MEKVNIQLVRHEDKIGQESGKQYVKFLTNIGWCSCFDLKTAAQLKQNCPGVVNVDIKENGNYKNIDIFYGAGDANNLHQPTQLPPNTPFVPAPGNTNSTQNPVQNMGLMVDKNMKLVSQQAATHLNCMVMTTKDVFIELRTAVTNKEIKDKDLMTIATALVKQAKEAFQ